MPAAGERSIVQRAAQRHGIEPRILWGVYGTETAFGKDLKTSSAGAEGPFQFEPATARSLGIRNVHDFAESADGAARYLAQFKGRGLAGMLSAYNAGPAGGIQQQYVKDVLANARSWNGAGLPQAAAPGASLLGALGGGSSSGEAGDPAALAALVQMISGSKPGSPTITPLTAPAQTAAPPAPEGFHLPAQGSSSAPAKSDPSAIMAALAAVSSGGPGGGSLLAGNASGGRAGGGAANVTQLHGLAHFSGKPVAAWIAPILQYAQTHGWHGTVTSGYRSQAEQEQIYNSGVRPAAKPGTSNHEFTAFPGGAVDVTEAQALARILSQSPYRSVLEWAGSKDPVHFSHPHGGGY